MTNTNHPRLLTQREVGLLTLVDKSANRKVTLPKAVITAIVAKLSSVYVHSDCSFIEPSEDTASLVPRLSRNMNIYRGKSLVSFIRKHDVIKIGPKWKGNVLHAVQPTMLQRSVCMTFDV